MGGIKRVVYCNGCSKLFEVDDIWNEQMKYNYCCFNRYKINLTERRQFKELLVD